MEPIEDWQTFWGNEEFDASRNAGLSPDQTGAIEVEDHLMDGGRANTEVALHVGFGGGLSEDVRIDVNEGQILALLFGEVTRGVARAV